MVPGKGDDHFSCSKGRIHVCIGWLVSLLAANISRLSWSSFISCPSALKCSYLFMGKGCIPQTKSKSLRKAVPLASLITKHFVNTFIFHISVEAGPESNESPCGQWHNCRSRPLSLFIHNVRTHHVLFVHLSPLSQMQQWNITSKPNSSYLAVYI